MNIKNLFSVRNIIIAVVTLVLIAATFGIALLFINKNKRVNRF